MELLIVKNENLLKNKGTGAPSRSLWNGLKLDKREAPLLKGVCPSVCDFVSLQASLSHAVLFHVYFMNCHGGKMVPTCRGQFFKFRQSSKIIIETPLSPNSKLRKMINDAFPSNSFGTLTVFFWKNNIQQLWIGGEGGQSQNFFGRL